MRDKIDPLHDYAESLSGPVPDYLNAIERRTYLQTVAPQMMSGRLQGRILSLLSKLLAPRCILEVGTFTAYATLCLAEGLAPGGMLHTVEGDAENAARARRHIAGSPFARQIRLYEEDATVAIRRLGLSCDLIFLDADKKSYPEYFAMLSRNLRAGGLLIADNVLWNGKAVDEDPSSVAESIHRYNALVADDPSLDVVMLPLRDGLSIARKR